MKKFFDAVLSKLLGVVCVVIVLFIVVTMTMMSMGIRQYVVMSGSMEPSIKVGSLLFCNTKCSYNDVEVGDVIMYNNDDTMITHRVIEKTQYGLVMKGDANDVADSFTVDARSFRGKVLGSIPCLGYVMNFVSNYYVRMGAIIAILIVMIASLLVSFMDRKEKGSEKGKKIENENSIEKVLEDLIEQDDENSN